MAGAAVVGVVDHVRDDHGVVCGPGARRADHACSGTGLVTSRLVHPSWELLTSVPLDPWVSPLPADDPLQGAATQLRAALAQVTWASPKGRKRGVCCGTRVLLFRDYDHLEQITDDDVNALPLSTSGIDLLDAALCRAGVFPRSARRGTARRFTAPTPNDRGPRGHHTRDVPSSGGRLPTRLPRPYRATLHHDPGYLMDYLGRVLRGWANYFRHGVSKATFSAIDSYAWERVTAWLRDKHKIGWPKLRRRFCLPGTWRLAVDGIRFKGAASVPVIRYRYRGYRIPTPWTPTATTS